MADETFTWEEATAPDTEQTFSWEEAQIPDEARAEKRRRLRAEREAAAREHPVARWLGGPYGIEAARKYVVEPIADIPQTVLNLPVTVERAAGILPPTYQDPFKRGRPIIPPESIQKAVEFFDPTGRTTVVDSPEQALTEAGSEFAAGLTTPENLPLASVGATGRIVRGITGTIFGGVMAGQVPEAARRAGEASVIGSPGEKLKTATELGLTMATAAAPAAAGERVTLPESMRALREEVEPAAAPEAAAETEVPSALQEQIPEGVLPTMRPQPGEGAEGVPATPSPEGVRGGPPAEEAARGAEVPLTLEELTKLEAKTAAGEPLTITQAERLIEAQKRFQESRRQSLEQAIARLPPEEQALVRGSQAAVEGRPEAAPAAEAAPAVKPSGFQPPRVPERFETLQDALQYRKAYEQAELAFYKSLGLTDEEAAKMFRAGDARSKLDVSSIEAKLSPENRERLEQFSTGEGSKMYQWDKQYDPEELLHEDDKSELSSHLVQNVGRESLPTDFGDKLIHAAVALRRLKEVGGTWMDVAKELDKTTSRLAASQGDKVELFKSWGQKLRQFAVQQGIDLPQETPRRAIGQPVKALPPPAVSPTIEGLRRELEQLQGGEVTDASLARAAQITRELKALEGAKRVEIQPGQRITRPEESRQVGRQLEQWSGVGLTAEEAARIRSQATPLTFSSKRHAEIVGGAPLTEGEVELLKSGRYSLPDDILQARPDLFPPAEKPTIPAARQLTEGEKKPSEPAAAVAETTAPESQSPAGPGTGEGPGAAPKGFGKYPAIQQLADQLAATPAVGTKQRLTLGQRIVDKWAEGKDAVTRAFGTLQNAKQGTKTWWEGIRRASDLDARLGEYDYAIQYSSATSIRAGKAIERQMRDKTDREAAAILIDAGRLAADPMNPAEIRQIIKDQLALLPADTKPFVRRAMERALDPSLELRQFAESLRAFYGLREQDAKEADLFTEGLQEYYTHIWQKESNMPTSLRAAIASGRLNTYFQFGQQRKLSTFFEGITQGKTPILDPAKVIPFYNFAMDRAIASRAFIKHLSDVRASDGRPAVDTRGGATIPDPLDADSPILVKPKTTAQQLNDYEPINHPAMQKWKWLTTTPEGRQVLMRGEVIVHPEFYEQLSRFMDRTRLAGRPGTRVLLRISSEAKGFKLGLLPSSFHILHVGSHAAFHWTNPFRWDPIDFEAPATRFAIEQGHLKLAPSPAELSVFQEGVAASGLVRKIPIIGHWAGAFSDWMFHQYIPRLKLNTFENAMARASSPLFATGRGIRAGRLTQADLAARIGDAVNNAYGELNQMFLGKFGRDPRTQRALRLLFLAPDFGEARGRFALKFFSRFGDEERLAMATMVGALYFTARAGNWVTHGNPETDWRHAFEVKVAGKWWGIRSLAGDVLHATQDIGQFLYVRLNPTYSRPASDILIGREPRTGRKLSWPERAVRIAQAFEPIGLGGLTEPDRTLTESIFQAMGLSNHRDLPVTDMLKNAALWRQKNGFAPVTEQIPTDEPSYMKLRLAINLGKTKDAQKMLQELRKTRTDKQIETVMLNYVEHPYTGSLEHEKAFVSGFTKEDLELYMRAQKEKENTVIDFYRLLAKSPHGL
jgi:hypothetical protein